MATTPGIDVSYWQGSIDWSQVAGAGYRFAVLRATVGNYYSDPTFAFNWTQARANGILVSAYHVVNPRNSASSQIDHFLNFLGDRNPDLPLVLDVELHRDRPPATVTDVVEECTLRLEQIRSRRPIIYTAAGFWNAYILPVTDWSRYDLWIANYGVTRPSLPYSWNNWVFWQYRDTGQVPGIGGNTDLNFFNGSYDRLRAYAGVSTGPARPRLQARVIVPVLNVRNGPGIEYDDIGDLVEGQIVEIGDLAGEEVWVEFEPGRWTAFRFNGQALMELVQDG